MILDEKQYRLEIAFLKPPAVEAVSVITPSSQIIQLINLLRKLHVNKASLSYSIWLLLKEDVRFFVHQALNRVAMAMVLPISDTDKSFLKQVQEAITLTEMLGASLVYDPTAAALKDDKGNYLRDKAMQLLNGVKIEQDSLLSTPQQPSFDPPPSLLLRMPSWPGKHWLDQHINKTVPKYCLATLGFLVSLLPFILYKTYQQLRIYPTWTVGMTVVLAAIFIGCPLLLPAFPIPALAALLAKSLGGLLMKSIASPIAYSVVSLGCYYGRGHFFCSNVMLCFQLAGVVSSQPNGYQPAPLEYLCINDGGSVNTLLRS